ncbi:hypothetical protein MMC22_007650 [Lobaria immixta]|nr:hypothetical protein [Lobaria immixta]
MAPTATHADHEYIVARQQRYIEAWSTGSAEKTMEFMDKEDFGYSNFGIQQENLPHAVVKDLFTHSFSDHHDVKLKTRSLHGHKHFTAWEWSMTFKFAKGPDGKRLSKEEARPQKLIGCTLMWWNDQDKIIRNHEYMQVRESQEEADVPSGPNQFLSGQSPSGVGTPKL